MTPRRAVLLSLFASITVVVAAYAVVAVQHRFCPARPSAAMATGESCASRTSVAGGTDPVMSAACRYSCATQKPYDEADVVAQPGAIAGRLTRCPVSGVVFAVDDGRPRVKLASGEYVFCCDRCVEKFRKNPGRFVSL